MIPDARDATSSQVAARPRRGVLGMALYGDLTHDSRVRREAASLAEDGWDVVLACLASTGSTADLPPWVTVRVVRPAASGILPGSDNPFMGRRGGRLGRLANKVAWLRGYVSNLRQWGRLVVRSVGPVDVWHLHDLTGLAAVAPNLDDRIPVVYDAHELFLETGTALRLPGPARAGLRAYERRLVRRASAVVTVNDALADELRRRYRPRRLVAVHNCPGAWAPPDPRRDVLREAAGIPASSPVLLYHGAMSVNRGVEQLLTAMQQPGLERAHLVLMGFGEMRDAYAAAARDFPGGRVHLLAAVPPAQLLDWVTSADIGVMAIQPSTLNHRLSTPNKLFECLMAGVPVVASDFPAVRRIVEEAPGGPVGRVCDPTRADDIANAVQEVLALSPAESNALAARCRDAAASRWNWATQAAGLLALYRDLAARS